MILVVACLIFGVAVGAVGATQINNMVDIEGMQQRKAIREKFKCERNEYTYFCEGRDDFYIATVKGIEYRIKFSLKSPLRVIYCEELVLDE